MSIQAVECDNRLRQLAVAFRMYTVDYDRRLPRARRWCDAIYPYISGEDLFQCPASEAKYGYAFNSQLDGADVKTVVRPASTVLLFESSRNERNAHDAGKSLCRPPRHPQGNFTAYVDGHVQAIGPSLAPLRSPASAPSPE